MEKSHVADHRRTSKTMRLYNIIVMISVLPNGFQVMYRGATRRFQVRNVTRIGCMTLIPNGKAHGANMGPIWGRQDPGGPHVGPMNFAIWDYMYCKWSDILWPVGCVRLFADYTISLSSLCRLIWRHWTTKMLVRYMLPSVCLRLRQFSQLPFIQYMGLCVFSLPNSPVMMVRMCTLSYYHHQTGSINH